MIVIIVLGLAMFAQRRNNLLSEKFLGKLSLSGDYISAGVPGIGYRYRATNTSNAPLEMSLRERHCRPYTRP